MGVLPWQQTKTSELVHHDCVQYQLVQTGGVSDSALLCGQGIQYFINDIHTGLLEQHLI